MWVLFRGGTYISNTAAISHELKVWPACIATAAKKRRAPAFAKRTFERQGKTGIEKDIFDKRLILTNAHF